jgi:hypothetical protein
MTRTDTTSRRLLAASVEGQIFRGAPLIFGAGKAHTPDAHAILQRIADVGLGYPSAPNCSWIVARP